MSRLEELEAIVAAKKASSSKTSWRSFICGATYQEYSILKTQAANEAARATQTINAATARQIEYLQALYRRYGVEWTAPAGFTKTAASNMIDRIKREPESAGLSDQSAPVISTESYGGAQ